MRPKILTRRAGALLAAIPLAGVAWLAASAPPASATGASTPAAVLGYLHTISGNHTISGVHNKEPLSNPSQYTAQAHAITGRWPGLWGGELGFRADDIANRQTMVDQAKTEWANGSLVNLTWHMCRPDVASCEFDGGVNGSTLSDAEWQQLITDGTTLNADYKAKLDTAVPYFQQLKDAGVPVLFRPLHEMNEGWAWWGGRPGPNGSARLFQITHDYLESKGLTNIIWVWNVKDTDANGGSAGASAFYPGDGYVDVASLDPWDHGFPTSDWYQALLNVAHGKPVSLAEVGTVPTPSQLAAQPQWTWFMIWADYITSANSSAGLQATFTSPRVLSQGQFTVPTGGGTTTPAGAISGYGGKCVDVAGASSANGTAVQLYDCNGTGAQSWTVGADGTIRALGKCLDVTGQGTANGTPLQLWDCNGSGAQQWTAESDGHLKNPQSGRYLDDPGGATTNATRLQIWDRNTNPWQTWHLPT
ncbi:mannan endo-1,4-beta-mannosidase [Actinacidiphila rubida]|uniref:Mannan endo-1,4-beta-mannosidase n=2 Tax=Actinacidiphila rubida TaxID=310780 RepID=A0A1H8JHA4_9ACTN|nr:glycosyl hydrolase [Actinacidiphila rubida]SEN79981.1 mannan endo-1,4-beta-mannosidase [Actinacidiphila rubida]